MTQQSPQTPEQSTLATGVQFRSVGKVYTFLTEDAELKRGDPVIVESEEGTSFGSIAKPPFALTTSPEGMKRVLRRASPEEAEQAASKRETELEYFTACRERIQSRELPMKLVDVELEEEGHKAIFLFFAEQRVDFRALVKDLSSLLHVRVEMRQIGSRDESKAIGCLGPCGLTTCCSTHLRQFQPISISMAKHQGLAPNPAKLTGMCGKLKCCLAYEQAAYDECRQGLPKAGAAVETPEGTGKVIGHNVLKRECVIKLYSGGEARMPCDQCRVLSQQEREAAITAARTAQEQHEARRERNRSNRANRSNRNGNGGNSSRRQGSTPQNAETPNIASESEKEGNDDAEVLHHDGD